jgi:hypothetical protein
METIFLENGLHHILWRTIKCDSIAQLTVLYFQHFLFVYLLGFDSVSFQIYVWFRRAIRLGLLDPFSDTTDDAKFLRHYWWCQNTSQTNPNCLGNIMVRLCCLPTGHYIISLVRKWALYNFSKNEHCFCWGKWTRYFYVKMDTIFFMWQCEIDIFLYENWRFVMWKWTLYFYVKIGIPLFVKIEMDTDTICLRWKWAL